jgi:hypothetical protein
MYVQTHTHTHTHTHNNINMNFYYFTIYKVEVEYFIWRKNKIIQIEFGGEYFSNQFKEFCNENGIIKKMATTYIPQQNKVVEQKK